MATSNYDARKYPLCQPFYGPRGPAWTTVFAPDFTNALMREVDKYSSLFQHLIDQNDPGNINGPAHAGNAQQVLESQLAFSNRQQRTFGFLIQHLANQNFIDEANQMHANFRAAAGAGNALPPDWVRQIWDRLNAMGNLPQTGLTTANQGATWIACTINSVGIDRETVRNFYNHLLRLNRQAVVPKTNVEVHIKMCQSFTFPTFIKDKCIEDLQTPRFVHAGGPLVGQPDVPLFVDYLEELWHSCHARGEIKNQAPPAQRPTYSNRVDGMTFSIDALSTETEEHPRTAMSSAIAWAMAAMSSSGSTSFIRDERDCWNCKGWGHSKEACPSEKKARPLSLCIKGLQEKQSRERARLSQARANGKRFIRRRGLPPNRTRAPAGNNPDAFYVYDDGSIYACDGSLTGLSSNFSPDELCGSCDDLPPSADNPDGVPLPPAEQSSHAAAIAPDNAAAQAPTTDTNAVDITAEGAAARIEQEFESLYSGGGVFLGAQSLELSADGKLSGSGHDSLPSSHGADTGECDALRPYWRRSTKVFAAAGLALLSVAAALLSNKRGARLGIVMAGCMAQAHSLQFAGGRDKIFNGLTFDVGKPSILASELESSAIVDTGASRCSSHKRKLFPPACVSQYNPPYRVRIADGKYLNVALEGGMVIKTRATAASTSAKKLCVIVAEQSLLVPDMHVTLISPQSLFQCHGIRTYFNDELYMLLPNGDRVHFSQTGTNYILALEDGPGYDEVLRDARNGKVTSLYRSQKVTLLEPLPITHDLIHQRIMHFSWDKLIRSREYVEGIDLSKFSGHADGTHICHDCIRGAFRGHRKGKRDGARFTSFGQRIYSDSCAMPKSTPFGYCEMYVFFDAATSHLALYFGKTTGSDEMLRVYKQFIADYSRFMPNKTVGEWVADGGAEFKSSDLDDFCREMLTRRKFIAPWSPWQNVSEAAWRIVLRPVRVTLAAANVSRALWPFAAAQAARVYNMLCPYRSAPESASLVSISLSALQQSLAPLPPPSYMLTKRKSRLDRLRVLFCRVEVKRRSKKDIQALGVHHKVTPTTCTGIHLGVDDKRMGVLVYLLEEQRFTTAAFADCFFVENEFPRCSVISGNMEFDGVVTPLANYDQQMRAMEDDPVFPDIATPRPAAAPGPEPADAAAPAPPLSPHGDSTHWPAGHCSHPDCTLGVHPDSVPHSFESQPTRRPNALQRARDATYVASAVEGCSEFASFGDVGSIYLGTIDGTWSPANCEACGDTRFVKDEPCYVCGKGGVGVSHGVDICIYPHKLNLDSHLTLTEAKDGVPQSTDEALNGPYAAEWKQAYLDEYQGKVKNGAFKLVPRPKGRKVVTTKIAHGHRMNDDGTIKERKARWVARGFSEIFGVDYDKTFTATAYAVSLRLFFVLVAILNLNTAKADVTKAFTLADLDRELFCEQMPGIEIPDKPRSDYVCLLLKALEGLKQAGFLWQAKHTKFIKEYGFKQSDIDPCIFVLHQGSGIMIILVWVDDMSLAYSDKKMFATFKTAYQNAFPSKFADTGFDEDPSTFTGITVHRDRERRRICLEQRGHVERAYQKFVPKGFPTPSSPAPSDRNNKNHYSRLSTAANDNERQMMRGKPYLAALATFMYLTVFTIPALSYHCSTLGQYMHDPSPACFEAVITLIAYAYSNRDILILTYGGALQIPKNLPGDMHEQFRAQHGLYGSSDASWLLRSIGGYIIMFYNGPLDWSVRIIKVICHSSAEAEIAAGCMMGKRITFIRQLLADCTFKLDRPITIFLDNTAALALIEKMGASPKTAHFLRWQFYLRYLTVNKHIAPFFTDTKNMLADPMTKVVDSPTLSRFLEVACNTRNTFISKR